MLARPKRFELLTPRFVVWCSIQLSYGRVFRWASGADGPLCIPNKFRKVAKERFSYPLRPGLARSGRMSAAGQFGALPVISERAEREPGISHKYLWTPGSSPFGRPEVGPAGDAPE